MHPGVYNSVFDLIEFTYFEFFIIQIRKFKGLILINFKCNFRIENRRIIKTELDIYLFILILCSDTVDRMTCWKSGF